jgi:uncharacterized protein YegL
VSDVELGGGPSELVLGRPGGPAAGPAGRADVVFVIDTTGSMTDKIDALLDTCQRFMDGLARRRLSWQAAVVGFGDLRVKGDRIVATGFSRDVERVKNWLRRVPRFGGGGNRGESSLEALDRALALSGYREGAVKTLILITDEPAHKDEWTPGEMTERLKEAAALTFVISPDLRYFRHLAKATGGTWSQVGPDTDFNSIMAMFDQLARSVASTVDSVHRLAGGDVKRFLSLPEGRRKE